MGDTLYQKKQATLIRKGESYRINGKSISKPKLRSFLRKLANPMSNNSIARYGIDTLWIKNNPSEVLELYSDEHKVEWNKQQKEFIYRQLTTIENYQKEFNSYLSSGCCYTMHQRYRYEYEISVFEKGKLTEQIKSRRRAYGFLMPWTTVPGDTIFDYGIEQELNSIILVDRKVEPPLTGRKLLKYLVDRIVDLNITTLYKLSAYSYLKEIEELNSDFEIISFEEVYGRGRYIWNAPKTMRIVLKNQFMLNNVRLNFLASKQGKSLYSRDSIKHEYKQIMSRIQSIDFITSFLENHPASSLDVYYFNNNGINEYNIDGINTNSEGWKRHDSYVESLKWYKKNSVVPGFDLAQAVETSKKLNCGCNYRFDNSYISKAIFFEINDENKNSSIWFLLPDNRVLLYLMEGDKVLNFSYSDFGQLTGLQYPCVLFSNTGQRIGK
jgi:hypothetical protein